MQLLDNLAKVVRALRLAREERQSDLAYEAGVSKGTVQRLEQGEPIKTDSLFKIFEYLGVSDVLFDAIAPAELSPIALAKAEAKKKPVTRQRARRKPTDDVDDQQGAWSWPEDQ